jgi:hypothetical protein
MEASRFSFKCMPNFPVNPVRAEAKADGPPSRFVLAPKTEFEKTIAEDSPQARYSPNLGRLPTR